jgi:hypothetical protein
MGYGTAYKPRRINYRNCRIANSNFSCPPKVYNKNKSAGYFSGNLITSGFLSTNVYQLSTQIQIASSTGSKANLVTYANKNLNAFGSWEGAPYGFKSPPRNKF